MIAGWSPATLQKYATTSKHYVNINKSTGNHNSDGTACKLYQQFIAQTLAFTTDELVLDGIGYHFDRTFSSTAPRTELQPFFQYMNMLLEQKIWDLVAQRQGEQLLMRHPAAPFTLDEANISPVIGLSSESPFGYSAFGKTYDGYNTSIYVNVINHQDNCSIDWQFRAPVPANEIDMLYVKWFPWFPTFGFMDFDMFAEYVTQDTAQMRTIRKWGDYLNRMRYVGEWFGREKLDKIRVQVYNYGLPDLIQHLTPIGHFIRSSGNAGSQYFVDTNMVNLSTNITDVLVISNPWPDWLALTSAGWQKIRDFVTQGGSVVVENFASSIIPSDLSGVTYGANVSLGALQVADPAHPIISPYGASLLPGYNTSGSLPQLTVTGANVRVIVRDANGIPVIWTNEVGFGRIVFIPATPGSRAANSAYYTILGNAILWARHQEAKCPWVWHDSYTNNLPWGKPNNAQGLVTISTAGWQNDSSGVIWSILGAPEEPKLVWISNAFPDVRNFHIHLNANYFGVSGEWMLFDSVSMSVKRGAGSDVDVRVAIPALAWIPVYVCNFPQDGLDIYTSGQVTQRNFLADRVLFVVDGAHMNLTYLLVRNSQKPNGVLINGSPLAEVARSELARPQTFLNEPISVGWFHDATAGATVIKFRAGSPTTVEVLLTAPPPPPPTQYALSVDTQPSGGPILIDGVTYATPASVTLPQGDHAVEAVQSFSASGNSYTFRQWNDGVTARIRTVNLQANTSIVAVYDLVPPPPPGMYTITIESTPITVQFKANGTDQNTPYSVDLADNDTLVIEMPSEIIVPAQVAKIFKFVEWSDGNANPQRNIVVNQDLELIATYKWTNPPSLPANATGVILAGTGVAALGAGIFFSLKAKKKTA